MKAPGRRASAHPERQTAAGVHAVGVGPGAPGFLTERARTVLRAADVVVGFETVVDVIRDTATGTVLTCGYDDQTETLGEFGNRVADGDDGVAVLMGDPNVSGYQFLGRVERAVDAAVRVVPGVSSVQVAASRARTPLEQSTVVSLHKRGPIGTELARLVDDAGDRHLLVLPRPFDAMPEDIAAHLVENGTDPSLSSLVYERLTHEREAVTKEPLGTLARDTDRERTEADEDTRFSDLSVVVVRAPRTTDTSGTPTEDSP
jgi:cobalt-precorrin-7 (C5)-methyltransferase